MPTVFREDGFRFFFYANEGDPLEPVHIHVRRGMDEAKIWLEPEIGIAYSSGFKAHELTRLMRLCALRAAFIRSSWHDFFR